MPRPQAPDSGLYTAKQLPGIAQRRPALRPVHKIRVCHDNRNYVSVPFTIPGLLTATDYGPEWKADRDYWIAKITASVGRHSEDTHPNDGTPGGTAIRANVRRIKADDPTNDAAILANDIRLHITENHHFDSINDTEDGPFDTNDFNIHHLGENDQPYIRVSQVGSSRPGTGLVVTLVLVPIP